MILPRILQVSAFFPEKGGGIEVVASTLAKKLSAHGCQVVHIAGHATGVIPATVAMPYETIQCRSYDVIEKKIGLPFPIWGLFSLIKLWKAIRSSHVVHIHDYLYVPCLAAFIFAKILGKKIVITQHIGEITFNNNRLTALLGALNRTLGVFILKRADATVFISARVKNYFVEKCRLNAGRVSLIENGVDHDVYFPASTRESRERVRFLFVGRFVEKKGLKIIEQCWDIPGVEWIFIGNGPLSPALWLGKHSRPHVYTDLRGTDLVPYYQQADLLILPSFGEGFPLVVQEALSCGTPVLVGDELMSGFGNHADPSVFYIDVFRPDVVSQLKSMLEFFRDDADRIRAARESAYQLSQQWSWEAAAVKYVSIYKNLL